MKLKIRFGLAAFLVTILVLGSGLGLSVRYYRSLSSHYVRTTRVIDGYAVSGSWRVDRGGNDRLVWLLVFPKGDKAMGGGGEGTTSAAYVEKYEKAVDGAMVFLFCSGICQNGKMLERSNQGRIWLYLTTAQTVKEVELPADVSQSISQRTFQTLENTPLWKDQLLPAADRESAAFQKQFEEQLPKRRPQI